MVWDAIYYSGTIYLVNMNRLMGADYYTDVLENIILPAVNCLFEDNRNSQTKDKSFHSA